jgi:predicted MFS family arabinose efflux permease
MNMATPLEQSMIMGICVEDERSAALGFSSALWSLPNALSSFVGAYLMGLGLLAAPFFLSGAFYIVSITLFWYFFRKTELREDLTD